MDNEKDVDILEQGDMAFQFKARKPKWKKANKSKQFQFFEIPSPGASIQTEMLGDIFD